MTKPKKKPARKGTTKAETTRRRAVQQLFERRARPVWWYAYPDLRNELLADALEIIKIVKLSFPGLREDLPVLHKSISKWLKAVDL